MAYDVVATELLKSEYDSTLRYLAIDLNNHAAASRFADELAKMRLLIADNPTLFGLSRHRRLREQNIRSCLVQSYLVFYRVEESCIVLLRLLHQSQAYESERYWDR